LITVARGDGVARCVAAWRCKAISRSDHRGARTTAWRGVAVQGDLAQ